MDHRTTGQQDHAANSGELATASPSERRTGSKEQRATKNKNESEELTAHGLGWRLFSASELLLGAVIVIGHNVFHVVPNEVPILFVLGLVSVRLRDGRWSAIGF